jgi:hypothetical protein
MNSDKKTIKISSRFWVEEIGGNFAMLIVFPIFTIFYWGERFYFIGTLVLLIGIIGLISEFRTAYNSQISFTNSEIKGQIGKLHFSELWEDIKVVQFSGHKTNSQLTIWTEKNAIQIPCKYFDEKELDKLLKECLSPAVFDALAYEKLPQFQEWQNEREKQFDNLQTPLQVFVGKSEKIIGCISLFFSLLMIGFLYLSNNNIIAVILLIFFGGLGLYLILWSIGKIEKNETILFRTLFNKHELSWHDLKEIYVNSNKSIIGLVGENCRIILPNPVSWGGKDKQKLFEFLGYKLETSGVQWVESKEHLYWRSKNFQK